MTEEDLTFSLLRGLPPPYNAFYASTSSLLDSLTFDDVVSNLQTYESHLLKQAEEHKPAEFAPCANFTQSQNQDPHNNRGGRSNRGQGRNQGKNQPCCQLCFKYGHRAINFYERFNKDFVEPQWNLRNQNSNSRASSSNPQANMVTTAINPPPQGVTWYPDSGASHHITPNLSDIQDPSVYSGPGQLYVGNGQGMQITHTGKAYLHNQNNIFKLKDVLPVPLITKNLLSIHKFALDKNVFIEFHAFFCLVKDNKTGEVVMRDTHKDGLYILKHMHQFTANIGQRASQETWHNRLGHPHFRIFQNILKDFEILVSHHIRHFICDVCCSSKSHKLPFKVSLHKSYKPLELIHLGV